MLRSKYIYVYIGLAVIGMFGGWFYWYNWGCTDMCPINSSWKLMTLKGGALGLLGAAMFHPKKSKNSELTQDENI